MGPPTLPTRAQTLPRPVRASAVHVDIEYEGGGGVGAIALTYFFTIVFILYSLFFSPLSLLSHHDVENLK